MFSGGRVTTAPSLAQDLYLISLADHKKSKQTALFSDFSVCHAGSIQKKSHGTVIKDGGDGSAVDSRKKSNKIGKKISGTCLF